MQIPNGQFISSFAKVEDCPNEDRAEYAFIGRSNVGKSSLINALTNRKDLAKVSSTPGKTQLINFFLIDDLWFLVDLPGYGYAKVSKKDRAVFQKMINNYLLKRSSLTMVFQLVDGTLPPQKIDVDFTNWLGQNGVPFAIILTKADRSTQRKVSLNKKALEMELLKHWETVPPIFTTSSRKGTGIPQLLQFIDQTNANLGFVKEA
jgi:GTP-binding protein